MLSQPYEYERRNTISFNKLSERSPSRSRSKLVEHHGFRKGLSFLSCHMDEDIAVLVSNASSHLVGATDPATQPEACDKLAQQGERATGMFLLLKDSLSVLAAGPNRPAAVLDAFLLRLAALEGFRPSLGTCITCGSTTDIAAFHVGGGGVL